ncbi:MAG: TIM barrel protein [Candidatus Hodarchaeales archaeon]
MENKKLSIGISTSISRFTSARSSEKKIDSILKEEVLNAVEFGLLNCVIGKMNIPGTIPYPSEKQISRIKERLTPDKYYLSVHGPYRISATSDDPKKLRYSKSNLSASLKVADLLEAKHLTFHAGSFKKDRYDTSRVKGILREWEEWRQEKGFKAKLAPEVGGKYNSFADFFTLVELVGSIDNMLFTWDISHDFARGGKIMTEGGVLRRLERLDETLELNEKNRLPVHFSGMEVGKKGEKNHTLLDRGAGVPWKLVFSVLREQNYLSKLNLICESKVPKGKEKILKGNAISDAMRVYEFLKSGEVVRVYKGKPNMLDYYFSK